MHAAPNAVRIEEANGAPLLDTARVEENESWDDTKFETWTQFVRDRIVDVQPNDLQFLAQFCF